MIAKGKIRGDGAKLARYLMTGEKGEIAQLVETRGLLGDDPVAAFAALEKTAKAETRCKLPFFHGQVRLAPNERLEDGQWMHIVDRKEKRLGFTGLPRMVSYHINPETGEKHLHIAWFRVDLEAKRAIDPGMFKNHLKQLARSLEKELALRELSSQRQPGDRARGADRKELEESRRLKTDIKAIRTDILDCLEKSDGGKAFKAAIEAKGLMLSNGDRRDCFVVIDQAGGQHALNKKLTGLTLAAIRERLADLDRQQLPSVEQAQAMQRARQAEREHPQPDRGRYDKLRETERDVQREQFKGRYDDLRAAEPPPEVAREFASSANRAAEPAAPNFDRDAADRAWAEKVADAGIAAVQAARQRPAPDAGRETRGAGQGPSGSPPSHREPEDMRPLGKTAGEIRAAWTLSRTAEELEEALAAKGITLAEVSAEEARQSERTAAFAKETGSFARVWRDGEIVAVDGRGDVHRLDQRTTGDLRPEIDARLDGFAGIDRAGLLNVTDAKEATQEASRAAYRDEAHYWREMDARPTGIERKIEDSLATTLTGTEFAAALDKAGITIAQATATDVQALDALREQEGFDRTSGIAHKPRHFATLQVGDFAAVTRAGDVFRLNPTALDFEEAEQRLADVQPRMPSVVEARAVNEIRREQTNDLWAQRRAENLQAYALHSENRNAEQDVRRTDTQTAGAAYGAADAIERSVEQASGIGERLLRGIGKQLAYLIEAVADFIAPPPPLTKVQAELKERADEERGQARADIAAYFDNEDARARLLQSIRSDDAERERQQQRDPDRDREPGLER